MTHGYVRRANRGEQNPMTTTSTSPVSVASLDALIGYPPDGHACPLCGERGRVAFRSINVALNGEPVCEGCLDTTSDPTLRAWGYVVKAVDDVDTALWSAKEEGADPELMSHLARLAASLVIHLARQYEPPADTTTESPRGER